MPVKVAVVHVNGSLGSAALRGSSRLCVTPVRPYLQWRLTYFLLIAVSWQGRAIVCTRGEIIHKNET
jgi:hypothetical protein